MPLRIASRDKHIPSCTRQCQHGDLTYESGYVGTAIKQQGYTINTARSAVATILVGEQFLMIVQGTVEVPAIGGATLGQEVSITTATGAITLGAPGSGQVKAGRVAVLPGTYGCPVGKMWVDLDAKDSL